MSLGRVRIVLAMSMLATAGARAQEAPDHTGGFVLADLQRSSVRGANVAQIAERKFNLVGLAEGRIKDVSWRLRGELERTEAPGHQSHASLRLQELNRVFDLGAGTTLSVGKRIYSIDQAYANQPLGFFQTRTDLADPTDSLAMSEGLPMAVLSWVGQRASIAALYSKDKSSHADGLNRGIEQSVLKFGYEFDGVSSAVILRRAGGESNGVGATVSATAGAAWSYYGSYYQARGTERPILPTLAGMSVAPNSVQVPGSWRSDDGVRYPRAAVGLVYSERAWPKLQVEFSHDRRGLSDTQYASLVANPVQLAAASSMLTAQGVRRNYVDVNLSHAADGWEVNGGVYAGMADWSRICYASIQYAPSSRSSVMLSAIAQSGSRQSERALSPLASRLAIRYLYRL
jgi:hypothetical protein